MQTKLRDIKPLQRQIKNVIQSRLAAAIRSFEPKPKKEFYIFNKSNQTYDQIIINHLIDYGLSVLS